MVVAAAMAAVLNSAKRFLFAGLAAGATPLVMVVAIGLYGERFGIQAAAWGMVAGGALEILTVGVLLWVRRDALFRADVSTRSALDAGFWRAVALLGLSAAVAALSPVVDQIFLAKLETGAITVYNYASKVNSIMIGLFGTAFSAALFPYLSDLAAQRDTAALKRVSWQVAALILPVSVAANAVVFFFSYDIVDILFARGSFTTGDTVQVASVQAVFSFQLVFYGVGLIAMRVLNATRADGAVLWISCLGVITNALFDWFFYARLGAPGIALSSVLTSVLNLVYAGFFIRLALVRQPR
jgi:putative peptidoglycan lipid II flippase